MRHAQKSLEHEHGCWPMLAELPAMQVLRILPHSPQPDPLCAQLHMNTAGPFTTRGSYRIRVILYDGFQPVSVTWAIESVTRGPTCIAKGRASESCFTMDTRSIRCQEAHEAAHFAS